jgi:predicted carbohydrate-binding protein with CBM5 and CBM33 domain
MHVRMGVCTVVLGVMTTMMSLLPGDEAHGHGWITSPASRQGHCARRTTSFDCGAIQWEPQSVEAPKGSMLCSGGGMFRILDEGNRPWPVSDVGRTVSFRWNLTAAHRTSTWEYFVDGRHFTTFDARNTHPPTSFTHTLSGLPTGRHTILARWNIADTPMAFYNCVDVNVGNQLDACTSGDEAGCSETIAADGQGSGLDGDDQGGCTASGGAAGPGCALATLLLCWRARRRSRAVAEQVPAPGGITPFL